MNETPQTAATILDTPLVEVVLADDRITRAKFLEHFEDQARHFARNMEAALTRWYAIDAFVREGRQPTADYACVAAISLAAINLLVQSVQCFLAGQPMASGNLARQSIESIAVAILSADEHLPVRRDFIEGRYSSNGALRTLRKKAPRMKIDTEAVDRLIEAKSFYDMLSHPSALTLAHGSDFRNAASTIGAAFDYEKLDGYRREIESIVALSAIFPDFIAGVHYQLHSWGTTDR